ncbi:helix-hairpin-helix domain-containing protein [Pedobacter sp. MC2016-14]|uniref:helix-hairpin-helix domain-containing protein n=1 Tax=Pedobacter sp. MC2016-14 TaxID=2897327 RepID=UPI001E65393B|nr:helix-hairpin-helix domain-containing protein [Pedobacter sp. MC2016-14]MCD0490192.1 helix-hairpin-helix domain-containing protein [Pedobacter sp. MC2016-14]
MPGTKTPFLKRTATALAFIAVSTHFAHAQQLQDQFIRDLVESLAETVPEDYDLSEISDRLHYYNKHPIDLNHSSGETLKNLIFLSPLQISNLFNHLKTNGMLLDLLELQSINGFDVETIQKIMPFVTLRSEGRLNSLSLKNLSSKGNHDLILRYAKTLEVQKGFTDLPGSRYLGSPEKLLGRYHYNYNDLLSVFLIVKKDAGEYLFAGNNKRSFDFMSAHIALSNVGRLKKIVVGDYNLQFGQGLTLWTGFGYGKGPDVTSVAKKDLGLKPSTSSNNLAYLRGVSATITLFKDIDFSPFISLKKLDASLSKPVDEVQTLVNLSTSGLHRTATEIKNKGSQEQMLYGAALQYHNNNLSIGTVLYHSSYKHPFITGTSAYNKYSFTGRQLSNAGLHYNYTYNNLYLYGEAAHSINGGSAFINGVMASLSRTISAVLVHRWYAVNYHNFFAQGMGENSEANNEKGLYAGLNFIPNKTWNAALYADVFQFPWLKYRIDAASGGYDLLSQLSFNPSKTFKSIARLKVKLKAQNPDDPLSENLLDEVYKYNYRLKSDYQYNRKLSFQNCIETVQYKKGKSKTETGILVYQDIDYSFPKTALSGNLRLAWFHTSSYNSRLYAYEEDVLYGFGSGMYNGQGYRTFLNLRYRLGKRINIWTRYAISIYPNLTTISSGLDEIQGNKKSEFKIQLRYEF